MVPSDCLLCGCAVVTCSFVLKTELNKRDYIFLVPDWITSHRSRHQRKRSVLAVSFSMKKPQACISCLVTQEKDWSL